MSVEDLINARLPHAGEPGPDFDMPMKPTPAPEDVGVDTEAPVTPRGFYHGRRSDWLLAGCFTCLSGIVLFAVFLFFVGLSCAHGR